MQPREILGELIAAIPGAVFPAGKEALETKLATNINSKRNRILY